MGAKRPLQVEDFPELSFKQPKQLDDNKTLVFTTEDFPSRSTTLRVDSPSEAKSNFCKSHFSVGAKNGDTDYVSIADNVLDGDPPLSLITSSNSPEDLRNHDTSFLSYFPRYIDFSIPYRPPEQFEDPYVILSDSSPRKEVPIGPDHQAKIPQLDMNASEKYFSGSNIFLDDETEQKMGICITKLPELCSPGFDWVKIGNGRTACSCLDVGSTRCVQQHINEAREKLRETIGENIFTELGFYDMSEEAVANRWNPDEEQIFQQVVYSNPKSQGRDFWKELSVVFPSRRKNELVSYYFNVFMLRKRAAQNRSHWLEIDSDDDEERPDEYGLKGIHNFCLVGEEEENSKAGSFGDQGCKMGSVGGSISECGNVCEDEDSYNNHGVCDGDVCKPGDDAVEIDGERGQMSGQ